MSLFSPDNFFLRFTYKIWSLRVNSIFPKRSSWLGEVAILATTRQRDHNTDRIKHSHTRARRLANATNLVRREPSVQRILVTSDRAYTLSEVGICSAEAVRSGSRRCMMRQCQTGRQGAITQTTSSGQRPQWNAHLLRRHASHRCYPRRVGRQFGAAAGRATGSTSSATPTASTSTATTGRCSRLLRL